MARDYRAEYRRRIARGIARGFTRSQARGHPTANDPSSKPPSLKGDDKLEAAIQGLNQGTSLTRAARQNHVSRERLSRFLVQAGIGERRGRFWVIHDDRLRQIPVLSEGRQRTVVVAGYSEARTVGEHANAVREFVQTNDIGLLKPFEGESVRAHDGRLIPLETDPNELHRIAAMENPPFYEIYEITD